MYMVMNTGTGLCKIMPHLRHVDVCDAVGLIIIFSCNRSLLSFIILSQAAFKVAVAAADAAIIVSIANKLLAEGNEGVDLNPQPPDYITTIHTSLFREHVRIHCLKLKYR